MKTNTGPCPPRVRVHPSQGRLRDGFYNAITTDASHPLITAYHSGETFSPYDELFESIKDAWNSLEPERLRTLTCAEWIERAA